MKLTENYFLFRETSLLYRLPIAKGLHEKLPTAWRSPLEIL